MKLYKIVFLFWIYNIFAIFQFSWMTGSWFDTEDLMQRMKYTNHLCGNIKCITYCLGCM